MEDLAVDETHIFGGELCSQRQTQGPVQAGEVLQERQSSIVNIYT